MTINFDDIPLPVLTKGINTLRIATKTAPIKKPSSKAAAIKELKTRAEELEVSIRFVKGVIRFNYNAKRAARRNRGREVAMADDMRIVVLCPSKNPGAGIPKIKTTGRNPYAAYVTGKTVEETMAHPEVVRRDINWDSSIIRPGGPVIALLTEDEYKEYKKAA